MEEVLLKKKLEHIEHDLAELKQVLFEQGTKKSHVITLKGMFPNLKVSEQDFNLAKKSLFPHI